MTLEVIKIVKPKIILTFVSPYNFIKEILEIKNNTDRFRPNPDSAHYYNHINNIHFDSFEVKKLIGIHHLSKATFDELTWQRFGKNLKKTMNQQYLRNLNFICFDTFELK